MLLSSLVKKNLKNYYYYLGYKCYRALGGIFLCCVLGHQLRLGALPPLPKAMGSCLAARLNDVGSGYQAWPKTLPKRANNVGSCYLTEPDNVGSGLKHLKKKLGFGWVAIPIDIIFVL